MAEARIVDARQVQPRHGRLSRHRPIRRALGIIAMAVSAVLVATVGVGAFAVLQFTTNLDTIDLAGGDDQALPQFQDQQGAFNVLVVGSDTREGQTAVNHVEGSAELNDVTMLLHVHEDHQGATVISFPRDLIVDFPTCPAVGDDGMEAPAVSGVQLNTALSRGGLPCAVALIESMTGLEIPYVAKITFDGVINMSTAVGGVPVCFAGPIDDPWSDLQIPAAGTYDLEGEQALQFLRSRHGVGDGSDLARISSQRVFLSALIRKVQSDEVLGNFGSLYQIAQVASQNMTLSTSLSDPATMVGMANVLRKIPLDTMQFVTYPTVPLGQRVAPDYYTAEIMMELIRNDEVIPLDPTQLGRGSEQTASPEPSEGADETADPSGDQTAEGTDASEAPDGTEASETPSAEPEDLTGIEGRIDGQSAEQESCVVPFGW